MEQFNHNNFDFEPIGVDTEKRNEGVRIASMYAHCFNTEGGQKVLEHLVQTFLTKPIAKPKDDLIQIGIREGRADLVRQILSQLEYAKKAK